MRRLHSFYVRAVAVRQPRIWDYPAVRLDAFRPGATHGIMSDGPIPMCSRRGDARVAVAPADRPLLRIPAAELDVLMGTLEVRQIDLEECLLRNERRFEHGHDARTRLYYGICGSGSLTTANGLSIAIAPHTLVVVPPVARSPHASAAAGEHRAMLAGNARILCGRFHAAFGDVVDLFGGLSVPIVERFAEGDGVQTRLRLAFAEFQARQPGSAAMTSLLMKQAMVLLLRRSLSSPSSWVERFAILRDHRIARAFAEMAAKPGAAHTVESLARTACLSRSTFMARFHELLGRAPMSVLRDLRMRQAAQQLRVTGISIGQVGQAAGYANNSGFIRAFRKAYGMDPRDYRGRALGAAGDAPDPFPETEPPNESRSC
jgi:AraC family transcriptional activator of mtrCDE